jgi:hypothetical protein
MASEGSFSEIGSSGEEDRIFGDGSYEEEVLEAIMNGEGSAGGIFEDEFGIRAD